VPLDRQAIEKRDFPIGRRGYDPAAVDAPLGRLAEEVEA
jgi:DivIVA domain-containing protein